MTTKIGPVQAKFNGEVELQDLDPPNGYTISGKGSGGVAGNARGAAKVKLEPDGAGTKLIYDVDAQVTGKLAQLGSRLIDFDREDAGRPVLQQVRAARQQAGGAGAAAAALARLRPPDLAGGSRQHSLDRLEVPAFPAFLWAAAIAAGMVMFAYYLSVEAGLSDWQAIDVSRVERTDQWATSRLRPRRRCNLPRARPRIVSWPPERRLPFRPIHMEECRFPSPRARTAPRSS